MENKPYIGQHSATPNNLGGQSAGFPQHEAGTELPKQRRDSRHRQRKPGLNIVTDFSKPADTIIWNNAAELEKDGAAPVVASQPMAKPIAMPTGPGGRSEFVDMRDLEGLRREKRTKVLPKAISRALSGQKGPRLVQGPGRRPVAHGVLSTQSKQHRLVIPQYFRASKQPANDMSPTARSVMIGISVPEDEVEAHRPSGAPDSAMTLITPATPKIVATSADVTNRWPEIAPPPVAARRLVSSIYSQAATGFHRRDANTPPMPSIPPLNREDVPSVPPERRDSCDTWELDSQGSGRRVSFGTVIDEDDASEIEHRPRSAVSDEAILLPAIDTGRPQSKGWWNLMLSPTLSRAGTDATSKGAASQEEPPSLPSRSSKIQNGLVQDDSTTMSAISPETPRRAGLKNIRSSAWSNWTRWEEDRKQALQLAHANDATQARAIQEIKSHPKNTIAPEDPEEKGGLAAEYYQASAFDVLNNEPYFECVDHDCARRLPELVESCKRSAVCVDGPGKALEPAAPMPVSGSGLEKGCPNKEAHSRPDSDSTDIEDDWVKASPEVRKALAKPIIKAAQVQEINIPIKDNSEEKEIPLGLKDDRSRAAIQPSIPPPYTPSPPQSKPVRYVGIMPPGRQVAPFNPDPISPRGQRALNREGGIPMAQVQQPGLTFHTINTGYPATLPPRPVAAPISISDIESPHAVRQKAEARRRFIEQEDAAAHKVGGLWRGRGCVPKNGCFGKGGRSGRTRRRWYAAITTSLVLMIILIVVLATQLTRKADQTPVQSQWLNLTGYPPMPTGISTMARPEVASVVTACVQPSSLWSCAVPREDQASISPNEPDQPNFRFEIRFRNGAVDANDTIPLDKTIRGRNTRNLSRRQSDPFTNSLFEPSPAAPSLEDQDFLGNTTDNITAPFSGEDTPFFISLLPSDPALPGSLNDTASTGERRRMTRRQSGSEKGSSSIPAPALLGDGTAAPANIVPESPHPFSQPVKLYDRGLNTEHYGFYTYYDRSIFIKRPSQTNGSASPSRTGDDSDDPENATGGSTRQDADLRCTWSQTRFLVRIWTNPAFSGRLVASPNAAAPVPDNNVGDASDKDQSPEQSSSAVNFTPPGSFPYPISITLDRHGGNAAEKGVYCYGVDQNQKIFLSQKSLVAEVRGAAGARGDGTPTSASGSLINPATGIFADGGGDGDQSGIDGGVGGCNCEWRNWVGGN